MGYRPVYLLFFLSGFSALIYEVVWVRVLGLVLGNTVYATSCVLAVFMGGLAIGAYYGGKLADRSARHKLKLYAWLELAIAFVAPAITLALEAVPKMFFATRHLLPVSSNLFPVERLLLCSLFLLVPTILMGATLPVLTRYLSTRFSHAAHFFSELYGFNTLGAMAGSLIACFFAFTYLGVLGTVLLAASLNLVVGLSASLLGQLPKMSEANAGRFESKASSSEPLPEQAESFRLLCFISAASGFTALSYEVLWTRLLRLYTPSNTYAFAMMVSTFLAGLALGSFIYDRWLKDKGVSVSDKLVRLAVVQFMTALFCAVSFLLLPSVYSVREILLRFIGPQLLDITSPTWLIFQAIVTAIIMLLPATLIGITFPFVGGLAAGGSKAVGTSVGTIYAANTLGCIFGSTIAGLVLIPAVGSQYAFEGIVGLTVLIGLLIVASRQQFGTRQKVTFCLVPSVLYVGLWLALPKSYLEERFVAVTHGHLIDCSEDATSKVLVVGYPGFESLMINGEPYASSELGCKRYMRLIAHWPTLLHPHPDDELVICFGVGTTSGGVSLHPEVKRLDICELSRAVIDDSGLFKETNKDVLNNPKVSCYINDGRNFLQYSDKKYDVISLEPPPPCDAGVVNLYSREFYALAKDHLKPGGMICQWVPTLLETEPLWKMMVKTACLEFPYVTVWVPDHCEGILIASTAPIKVDPEAIKKRLESAPLVKQNLYEVGLSDPYALLSTLLMSNQQAKNYVGQANAITDDKPQLEFFLPYSGAPACPADLESYPGGLPPGDIMADKVRLDRSRWAINRDAMHLLRLAGKAKTVEHDRDRMQMLLDRLHELLPNNIFFDWTRLHPGSVG